MNEIVNRFLLVGDKFMPEMHLRQPGFTYSACGPFTKHKERIQKFKETGDSRYIYHNKLDKACFQHDMSYGDFKDLLEEKFLIKYCVIKDLILLKIENILRLASMGYKVFDKKPSGRAIKNEIISNKELAEELHKPIVRKFKK